MSFNTKAVTYAIMWLQEQKERDFACKGWDTMNEEKLSPPNGVEEHNLREKKEMEQDTGNYTYDFFTFRNVLISAVVLGVIILVISLVRWNIRMQSPLEEAVCFLFSFAYEKRALHASFTRIFCYLYRNHDKQLVYDFTVRQTLYKRKD